MESLGYILPEAMILLFIVALGLGIIALRRRFRGEPVFTERDHRLFFGAPSVERSFWALGRAVAVFSALALLEVFIFAPFGAAILSGVLILTLFMVVRYTLM